MTDATNLTPIIITASGVLGGLYLFLRGLGAYRGGHEVSDIGTSSTMSLAAGEVRVTGRVERDVLSLVSPLQSRSCVYYRARVSESRGRSSEVVFEEERAVGFRLRDEDGAVRVFPRDGRWEVPVAFTGKRGLMGDEPSGLNINQGSAYGVETLTHAQQVAALLTIRGGEFDGDDFRHTGGPFTNAVGLSDDLSGSSSRREYEEARVEVGDIVTVIGMALPFGELADPVASDRSGDPTSGTVDADIAAEIAKARAAGRLAPDAASAWGNAAIPGFGIGRPTTAPVLDPSASTVAVADPSHPDAVRAAELFDIPRESLVIANTDDDRLHLYLGSPTEAVSRAQTRFLAGIGGAMLSIVCAVALALQLGGAF